jgi:NSS family neurotransmitter:Na+ symporter
LGFILAASGSAVGLGNIWRFPYVTQENGGGIFVLLYLACVFFIGFPVMLGELTLGRHAEKNPVGAYRSISRGWSFLGYLGVLTGAAILSYYGVVAGWTVGYLVKSIAGDLDPDAFGGFVADWRLQVGYLVAFLGLTAFVVAGGVRAGIERASSILMPVLLVLMIGLIVRGLTLPTAGDGLRFYLTPDLDKVTGVTAVSALGQAFFSLSLGMGAMITYGSYIRKDDNLVTSALSVVTFDTLVALLAGFLVFPVIGHGLECKGPTLVFVAMLDQFSRMPGGTIVAILFFLCLAVAALTSTVSLLEVPVAWLIDERGMSRRSAVAWVSGGTLLLGIPSALSLGAVPGLTQFIGEKSFLDVMDYLFGNLSLTIGAMLMSLFLVYRWGIGNAAEEVKRGYPRFGRFVAVWRVLLGFVVPLVTLGIFAYMLWTGEGLS